MGGHIILWHYRFAIPNHHNECKLLQKCSSGSISSIQKFFGDLEWIFQHDNAPIHTAGVVKSWIRSQNVKLLNWPPYSPDLNVIENVWGWLVRKVYASGKQYNNRDDLIYAIKEAWSTISLDYIKSLYDSIPDRMYEVVLNKGGPTHY